MDSPHGTVTPPTGTETIREQTQGSVTVSTSTYNLIREAIASRRQVVATYDDAVLHLCPHAIGRTDGRAQALFFQFSHFTTDGRVHAGSDDTWRCIPIDALRVVSVRNGVWHGAGRESRPDCVSDIDIEVEETGEAT